MDSLPAKRGNASGGARDGGARWGRVGVPFSVSRRWARILSMTSWSSIQASNSLCKKTDFVEARPDRAKAANPSKARTELVYRFNETCGKNGSRRGNSQPFDLAQIGRRETALVYACCIEPLNPRVI